MKLSSITHRFISVVFLVAPGGGNAQASALFVSVLLLCHLSVNAQTKAREAAQTMRIGKPETTQVRRPKQAAIADVRPARMRESFSVGYAFGDRDVFNVKIERPGPLAVHAAWQGSASSLALILNGPGQTGYYARQDGASPLRISFEITPELLRLGNEWTISIVNFSSRGSASGVILIEYPASVRKLTDLAPDQRAAILHVIGKKPASGKTEQRILPDGSIEIRYPDGRIVRIHKDGRGRTIIFPDGRIQEIIYKSQVQPGNPPPLPSDETLVEWLNSYNDNLLVTIQTILQNDQASIDNLKNVESGKPLLEVIRLRIRFVNTLAGTLATEP